MAELNETEKIVIIVLCVVAFVLAVLIVLVWACVRWRNSINISAGGGSRGKGPLMHCSLHTITPFPNGADYEAPLTITIIPNDYRTCEVHVKVIHHLKHAPLYSYYSMRASQGTAHDVSFLPNGGIATSPPQQGSYGVPVDDEMTARANVEQLKNNLMGYLKYTQPLYIDEPGRYIIRVHTIMKVNGEPRYYDLQQYHYTVVSGGGGEPSPDRPRVAFQAPRIIPDSGEVTDITPVKIVLGDGAVPYYLEGAQHTGREHILYSTDGTFPSVVYTGPFTLPVPKGSAIRTAHYTIRAVATDGTNASPVATATLDVIDHQSLSYDPSIPAPTAQVEAVGAMLYFETPTERNAVIHYRLEFEGERQYTMDGEEIYRSPPRRRQGGGGGDASYVDEDHASKYYEINDVTSPGLGSYGGGDGSAFADVSKARDVDSGTRLYTNKSIILRSDVRRIYAWTVPQQAAGDYYNNSEARLQRSKPAIYDVCLQRIVPHGKDDGNKSGKGSKGRCHPPVICVTCSDLHLTFDEPPSAYKLLYTLDGVDPASAPDAITTHRFRSGAKPIDISKCAHDEVTVTARYFSREERGLTRYGDKFSRGFHFRQ